MENEELLERLYRTTTTTHSTGFTRKESYETLKSELKLLKMLKNIILRESNNVDIIYKDCSKKKIQFIDGIMISIDEYDFIKEILENGREH